MCHFPAEKLGAATVRGVPGCDEHAGEGGKQGGGGVAPGGGRNHISGTRIQQQIGAHRCLQVNFPTQNPSFYKCCKSLSKVGVFLLLAFRCVMAVLEEEECLNQTASSTEATSANTDPNESH